MRNLRFITALVLFLLGTVPCRATPFFARTYNMTCESCHAGYPRLNSFGLAFKANNFRIPGAEQQAFLAWQKTLPIAVQVVRTNEEFKPGKGHADFTDVQLLAGGLLTKTTSFYVHHSLWIDDIPTPFPSYEIWGQQVLNENDKIMLKAGQFELPYAYSPSTHLVSSFAPLPFGAGIGNDVRIGSAMRGFQLSGLVPGKARWYAAYGAPSTLTPGNANGERQFFGQFHDLFARVSTADLDHNVGAFAYLTHQPLNANAPGATDQGYRVGLDGSYLWRGFQFFAMPVYGEDKDPLGTGQKGVMRSGFIEADRMLAPWVGLNLRYEAQTVSSGGVNKYTDGKIIGLRVYPFHVIRLTAEYRDGDHGTHETSVFAGAAF